MNGGTCMLGIKVKYFWYQLGSIHLLNTFHSTVAFNLEKNKMGSRFPALMSMMKNGLVEYENCKSAMQELETIKEEFKLFPIEKIVWDNNENEPIGFMINEQATDLSNFFRTNNNEDLISVLKEALGDSISLKESMVIKEE